VNRFVIGKTSSNSVSLSKGLPLRALAKNFRVEKI